MINDPTLLSCTFKFLCCIPSGPDGLPIQQNIQNLHAISCQYLSTISFFTIGLEGHSSLVQTRGEELTLTMHINSARRIYMQASMLIINGRHFSTCHPFMMYMPMKQLCFSIYVGN